MAALLVRTWNLFHGNTKPPRRRAFLEEMVRLAASDSPDVLCLQELPAWSLGLLDDWSGMTAIGDVAARPTIGPLPATAGVGRRLTSLHHGLLRSAFSGQANAVLVAPALRVLDHRMAVLNPRRFRRAQARWLGLGPAARLAWAGERRICQAVRLALPSGGTTLVCNLHATSYPPDERLADAEVLRAAAFGDGLAGVAEPLLLCGDLNVPRERSRTLADLAGEEWGFSEPGPGIDQVLVRGAPATPPVRWPPERRTLDGLLLSDHAPVEVRMG
jgi:endonuclease/exonuclease/phosphatase family metal-dependent hydrolase